MKKDSGNTITIENYIPFGRKNAISRHALEQKTGCSDRINRELISESCDPIINIGGGYYIPDVTDEQDVLELKRYFMTERARIRRTNEKMVIKFSGLAEQLGLAN